MKVLLIITLLLRTLSSANADCEKRCVQGQNYFCTGDKTFVLCLNSQPDTTVHECPPQFFCVNKRNKCEKGATPSCVSGCAICNSTTGIACLTNKVYAFCFEDNKPNLNTIGTCEKQGTFCNANVLEICSSEPSCGSKDIGKPGAGTPTGSTPTDIISYCKQIKQVGKFAPTGDITCKRYNYCYISYGEMMGKQYSCPGNLVFDCKTQQCSSHCNNNCPYPGLPGLPYRNA